jgi:hypothetical protein
MHTLKIWFHNEVWKCRLSLLLTRITPKCSVSHVPPTLTKTS